MTARPRAATVAVILSDPPAPSLLSRTLAAAVRSGNAVRNHPAFGPAAVAALAGGGLACVALQWTLRLGGDPAVTLAGRAAVCGGVLLGWLLAARLRATATAAGPAFAAAVAAGPALAGWGESFLSTGEPTAGRLLVAAAVTAGPAAVAAGLLGGCGAGFAGVRLIAAGGWAAVCGLLLAPAAGLQNAALACAAGAVAAAAVSVGRTKRADSSAAEAFTFDPAAAVVAVAGGAVAAWGLRAAGAFFPLSADVLVGRAAVAVAAVGVGMLLANRVRRDRRALVGGLAACGGAAAVAAGGPLWVELNLWGNATLASPALLTDLRILVAAAFLLPACVGAGVVARAGGGFSFAAVCLFAAGLCGGEALLTALPDAAVLAGAVGIAAAATAAAAGRCGSVGVPRRLVMGSAAGLAAVAAGVFAEPPAVAPRVLFSVLPTLARQGGVGGATLAELDDARRLARVETRRDDATLWRRRGAMLTVRHAGLPAAAASVQPDLVPRDAAAVLRSALPLCLAESPRRVLLLGTPGPEGLAAVTAFPVLDVVACDGRPEAVAAVRDALAAQRGADPFADGRVTLAPLDAPLAVRSEVLRAEPFDVLIHAPAHAATAAGTAESTAAFAARAAALLGPAGVYCRPVSVGELGPAPLLAAAATLRTAFAEVRAVETVGGEWCVLATNAPDGFVPGRLGRRLDKPHARRLLGECGWDWSVPLGFSALTPAACEKLAAGADPVTAADGAAAFALPRALMAWGEKRSATVAAVGPLATRLIDTAVPPIERPRVEHRLQEVAQIRADAAKYPDRPWAYRSVIKQRLTKNPRSVIRQTAAGVTQVRHPEDERRKRYVEALAAATTLGDADLAHLEIFAEPYDPLVTPALPAELAVLYAKRGDRDAARLRCLLKSIHFAPAADRSVRSVCEALTLLSENPAVIPDAAERYDAANGLLQVLKLRWEARGRRALAGELAPKTGVALHDVRRSLDAVAAGLGVLAACGEEAGVDPVRREARAAWIASSLERPLKGHRAGLHATHKKRLGFRNAVADAGKTYDDPAATE